MEVKNLGLELNPNYKGERYSEQLKTEIAALTEAIKVLEPKEMEISRDRNELTKTFRKEIESIFTKFGVKVKDGRATLDNYSWNDEAKRFVLELSQEVGNHEQNIRMELTERDYRFVVVDVNMSSFSWRCGQLESGDTDRIFSFTQNVFNGVNSEELFNAYAHYNTECGMNYKRWEELTVNGSTKKMKDIIREKERELKNNYSVKIGDDVFVWTRYGEPSLHAVIGKYGKKAKLAKVYKQTNDEGQEIRTYGGDVNYGIDEIMTIKMHDEYLAEEARKRKEREERWAKNS